jgi:hypothetical protein
VSLGSSRRGRRIPSQVIHAKPSHGYRSLQHTHIDAHAPMGAFITYWLVSSLQIFPSPLSPQTCSCLVTRLCTFLEKSTLSETSWRDTSEASESPSPQSSRGGGKKKKSPSNVLQIRSKSFWTRFLAARNPQRGHLSLFRCHITCNSHQGGR